MAFSYPTRWTPKYPEKLQLFTLGTANGVKVSIALEEMELDYEAHLIDITKGDQFDPEYTAILNPNSKIPSLVDPNGPGGEPIALMESNAILLYLAEKTNRFIPEDEALRWQTIQWLDFQSANVGPMLGQFGHFHKFAKDQTTDSYAVDRYTAEGKRLLGILDKRLEGADYLVGDSFTIADIATAPWLVQLEFYGGKELMGFDEFQNLGSWMQRCLRRPAAAKGLMVGRG